MSPDWQVRSNWQQPVGIAVAVGVGVAVAVGVGVGVRIGVGVAVAVGVGVGVGVAPDTAQYLPPSLKYVGKAAPPQTIIWFSKPGTSV